MCRWDVPDLSADLRPEIPESYTAAKMGGQPAALCRVRRGDRRANGAVLPRHVSAGGQGQWLRRILADPGTATGGWALPASGGGVDLQLPFARAGQDSAAEARRCDDAVP